VRDRFIHGVGRLTRLLLLLLLLGPQRGEPGVVHVPSNARDHFRAHEGVWQCVKTSPRKRSGTPSACASDATRFASAGLLSTLWASWSSVVDNCRILTVVSAEGAWPLKRLTKEHTRFRAYTRPSSPSSSRDDTD
jgi:hypothetical protein